MCHCYEMKAVDIKVDVLHGCKLSRCHALEVGGHGEVQEIVAGVAENVSIDGHR